MNCAIASTTSAFQRSGSGPDCGAAELIRVLLSKWIPSSLTGNGVPVPVGRYGGAVPLVNPEVNTRAGFRRAAAEAAARRRRAQPREDPRRRARGLLRVRT